MKTKSFFFLILLLFLSVTMFTSCSPNSTDEELYEIELSASGKSGQGSTGGKGGVQTEEDDL